MSELAQPRARRCACGHRGIESHSGGMKEGYCKHCHCAQFTPSEPLNEPIDYNTEYRVRLRKNSRSRKRRAERGGYFWLPCTVCKEDFGGFEWKEYEGKLSSVPGETEGSGKGICPACCVEGRGWSTIQWFTVQPSKVTWTGKKIY